MSSPTEPVLLDVQGVTVSFDGFKALTDLSLQVPRGSLRVLIGPNGAGSPTAHREAETAKAHRG